MYKIYILKQSKVRVKQKKKQLVMIIFTGRVITCINFLILIDTFIFLYLGIHGISKQKDLVWVHSELTYSVLLNTLLLQIIHMD